MNHNSDEVLGRPLSVYGDRGVSESIFDGATHIIPLADVVFCQKFERETGRHPHPDLEPRLGVFLKQCSMRIPSLYLYGDEIESFTRAWRTYRSELEKDTLAPVRKLAGDSPEAESDELDHKHKAGAGSTTYPV